MTLPLDFEHCYRAVTSRDPRFDGWFYTAVTTTKIYCRPSCPARTPKRANVRFYPSSAAAQRAGFRACLRCRPDAAPGSPAWDVRADVAARAMRLIADGTVDRDGVPGLARRLGYTERHLNRLLTNEVGAGPLALARAQRAQTARVLIETTGLGFGEVAFASGFGSVRQFNDTVREVYGVSPTGLRRGHHGTKAMPAPESWTGLTLRLAYRRPFAPEPLIAFLAARTLPGVDTVEDGTYRRALLLPHGPGVAALTPADGFISATLRLADMRDVAPAVARCRRLLDLSADPVAVDEALSADPALAADVRELPGVRVPRAVDGFEMLCRAIVGQQISVPAARRVLGRIVDAVGTPLPGAIDGLTRTFPTPEALLDAPDELFAMPAARRATLRRAAAATAEGDLDLNGTGDPAETREKLLALPGVGPWTADYVAMRALGEPDAFLPTDLGVRRGAAALGLSDDPDTLAGHAESWRPWRSYTVIRLWRHA